MKQSKQLILSALFLTVFVGTSSFSMQPQNTQPASQSFANKLVTSVTTASVKHIIPAAVNPNNPALVTMGESMIQAFAVAIVGGIIKVIANSRK